MTKITRRAAAIGAVSGLLLAAACGNGVGTNGAAEIDGRVTQAMNYLDNNFPATRDLKDRATGVLVMPVVTEAGLGLGGSYGRGALQVNGASVDYYSATQATWGLQVGAKQYSHVLYFMTEDALREFRESNGWAAGAEVAAVFLNDGENLAADTTTVLSPVVAVVFGEAGAHLGATLEGTKYTRIIP
ncbi:MAG: lipid-binding SYLF domain-containing protein [Pseudomonadota bacterium]